MGAQFRTGENVRVDINDVEYSIKKFSIKQKRPRKEVPNTEGKAGNPLITDNEPGYMSAVAGLESVEITIEEATFDLEANFWTAPIELSPKDYIDLKIYPDGRGGDYHWFPSVLIDEANHEGEVGELQPMSFHGESDSKWTPYGIAKT